MSTLLATRIRAELPNPIEGSENSNVILQLNKHGDEKRISLTVEGATITFVATSGNLEVIYQLLSSVQSVGFTMQDGQTPGMIPAYAASPVVASAVNQAGVNPMKRWYDR